jgi:hypothetical protein
MAARVAVALAVITDPGMVIVRIVRAGGASQTRPRHGGVAFLPQGAHLAALQPLLAVPAR